MSNFIDLTGQKFGRLTVIERVENNKHGKARWKCECECGNDVFIPTGDLKSGRTQSCGCFNKERTKESRTTHGLTDHPLYRVWSNMRKRCYGTNNPAYATYGARGIQICDEWLDDFQVFYDWAISNGFSEGLSIDRIDNDGNYEPSNCQWITISENIRRMNLYHAKKGTGPQSKKIKQKIKDTNQNKYGKIVEMISPEGFVIYTTEGINQFCREWGLNRGDVSRMLTGGKGVYHVKGWVGQYVDSIRN